MLCIVDNVLIYKRADRAIVIESLDYTSQYRRLVRYGMRPTFAAVLADRPIVDLDEMLEFGVEFGLIER